MREQEASLQQFAEFLLRNQWSRSALGKKSYVSAYDIATIYTGIGDVERAFEWLDKAYAEHSSFLIHIPWDPRFDPLRSDPRFAALLARVGLPDVVAPAHGT